jgi:hypothetical protein
MALDILALVSVGGTILIGIIAQIQQFRCVKMSACGIISCESDLSNVESNVESEDKDKDKVIIDI